MAANLSAVMDDTDKVQIFYDDAKAHGLEILPPDVNASGYRFIPLDAKRIRYGLGAVKGTGRAGDPERGRGSQGGRAHSRTSPISAAASTGAS